MVLRNINQGLYFSFDRCIKEQQKQIDELKTLVEKTLKQ